MAKPEYMRVRVLALLLSLFCSCSAARGTAQSVYLPVSARDIVVAYNRGLRATIAPGVFFPTHGGRVGFSIAGDVRYGFLLGPIIVAPGIRLAGYFPSDTQVLAGFATVRTTVPVGPVGPYVLGGIGPGYRFEPSDAGLAYLAGGGFMVHIGRRFGIGAEATYQAVTRTHFSAIFVGPTLLFAF